MGRVEVKIHGKHYLVSCPEGKEEHLTKLAAYIDERMAEVDSGRTQVPEAQLLVLTSLLVADELATLYNELDDLRRADGASDATCAEIDAAADRIVAIAERLEKAS